MRGCTRGCRFCQAGMIFRPVRERPVDEVLQAVDEMIAHCGFEEVSFLSLSSSDYSYVEELVRRTMEKHGDKRLSVGLPSLRIESSVQARLDDDQDVLYDRPPNADARGCSGHR
jgi:radical SAM superfamily enzyme YgiQ (UPF0313 family)